MPSIMQRIGTPNPRHNLENEYRKHLENVDPNLSQYNLVISRRSVENIYEQYLQPAFEKFNAKQKRKERRLDVKWGVSTALEYQRAMDIKARASKNSIDQKGKPPIREIVWQIGNPAQGYGCADQTDSSREEIFKMLQECSDEAHKRYKQFLWGDEVIHADEVSTDAESQVHGSVHMHSSFVPICLQNKQGPAVQVAFERCLKEMGFESFNAWKHDLDQLMEDVLRRHGMERTIVGSDNEHQDSSEYHRQQREIARTKRLEKERINAENRLNEINATIDQVLDDVGQRVDTYIQGLTGELLGESADAYNDAMFFVLSCSDDEFDEISKRGHELKQKISLEEIADAGSVKRSLDEKIASIAARKMELDAPTWQMRQKLWERYSVASRQFWNMRADLNADYQLRLDIAYQRRRDANRSYYDAMYFLNQSRGLLETIIIIVWLVRASKRRESINIEIEALKRERAALAYNTICFSKYSRAYREELKAGKFPGVNCMEHMARIVRKLDAEYQEYLCQSQVPAKHHRSHGRER